MFSDELTNVELWWKKVEQEKTNSTKPIFVCSVAQVELNAGHRLGVGEGKKLYLRNPGEPWWGADPDRRCGRRPATTNR